jgi:hypothetical protein
MSRSPKSDETVRCATTGRSPATWRHWPYQRPVADPGGARGLLPSRTMLPHSLPGNPWVLNGDEMIV